MIDNLNEPDIENLIVSGIATSNNVGVQDLQKTGSIVDIDPFPILQLEDLTVVEGQPFIFEIKLLNANSEPMQNYAPIILNITTLDETTTRSLDYVIPPLTNIIPANTESITQIISTIDDSLNEDTETMLLQITTTPQSSTYVSTGTIKDNDVPNLFSPNNDGKVMNLKFLVLKTSLTLNSLFMIAGVVKYIITVITEELNLLGGKGITMENLYL
jgi:hypothetical protein